MSAVPLKKDIFYKLLFNTIILWNYFFLLLKETISWQVIIKEQLQGL